MPKTVQEMEATMLANLAEKTGKSIDQWLKIARGSKLAKHGELMKFLKSEHGITHGYANMVALRALAKGEPASDDDLVEAQYSGKKAALRPIYDRLVDVVRKLGKDVEIAPKKGYVSLRRNKQFGLIQPSTATRVDVGIILKGIPADGRLEASGSFNAMVSHRVRVGDPKEVDAELKKWLKQAYEGA